MLAYNAWRATLASGTPAIVLAKIARKTLPANVWALVMLALLMNARFLCGYGNVCDVTEQCVEMF